MEITLNFPNNFTTFQSVSEIEQDIRLSYSLWLFKNAKVTLTKAAELGNLTIYEFMAACKKNDIPVIDMSKEDLLEDLTQENGVVSPKQLSTFIQ
jgi:predicted HTH domain antitoxin